MVSLLNANAKKSKAHFAILYGLNWRVDSSESQGTNRSKNQLYLFANPTIFKL